MKFLDYRFILVSLFLFNSYTYVFADDYVQSAVSDTKYNTIDHQTFNKSLLSAKAKGEDWTFDPVIVSLKFIGPFEGVTQTIERIHKNPESSEAAEVIITNEGLLDDSVMGLKYKLTLKRIKNGAWVIESAGKVVKCWKGRGHTTYSKELCN